MYPSALSHRTNRANDSTPILCALLLLVVSQQAPAQDATELKQRFLQEAPARWKEYVRLSAELQGILSFSHTGTLNAYDYRRRSEYKTNGKAKVLKVKIKDVINGKVDRDDEEAVGFNTRYAFTVRRKSAASPWVLTSFFTLDSNADLGKVGFLLNDYLRSVNCAVMLESEALVDVLHKPEFQIGQCRKIQQDGEELVEVAFTYSKMDGNRKRHLSGKLNFDPNRFWCVRSADIQATGEIISGTEKSRCTQSDARGGLPPLWRRYESEGNWTTAAGQKQLRKVSHEATLTQPGDVPPDEEFTLAAFGIPEPFGGAPKPSPWYLWLAVGGIICLGAGAVFRMLRQRSAPAPQAP